MAKPIRTYKEVVVTNINGTKYLNRINVAYNKNHDETYCERFNTCKEQGFILNDSYNDNIWCLVNKKEDLKQNKIDFQLLMMPEWKQALKAFTIDYLYYKIASPELISKKVSRISNVIRITNYFSIDHIKDLNNFIMELVDFYENKKTIYNQIRMLRSSVMPFMIYIQHENTPQFVDLINEYKMDYNGECVRELPAFEDLIEFDSIIEDYFDDANPLYVNKDSDSYLLRNRFKPIELWWKLTTIIPIRPGEFVRLKKDCAFYCEDTKEFKINIPRIKIFVNTTTYNIEFEEFKIQTLPITIELFELIQKQEKLITEDSKFLFNYDTFLAYSTEEGKHKSVVQNPLNTNSIGTKRFERLLEQFYKRVVKDIYGREYASKNKLASEKLEHIVMARSAPGDTRHLAVGNLTEQGYSALTIANMCHHSDIDTQVGYAKYIVKTAEIKSKVLSKRIKSLYRYTMEMDSQVTKNILKNNSLDSDIIGKGQEVDFGICFNKYALLNCPESECLFCKYFRLKVNESDKSKLRELTKLYKTSIINELYVCQNVIVELLKLLSRDTVKNDNGHFVGNPKVNNDISARSNQVISLTGRLAIVEAVDEIVNEIEEDKLKQEEKIEY